MDVSQNYAVKADALRICAAAGYTRCTGIVLHREPLGDRPRHRAKAQKAKVTRSNRVGCASKAHAGCAGTVAGRLIKTGFLECA
jgi:hypothetical protein